MNELQYAVDKLLASNISAEYKSNKQIQIIGGTEVSEYSGIKVYKNGFNVTFEDGAWIVRLPGEGQMISEYIVSSLEDAVQHVLEFYQ